MMLGYDCEIGYGWFKLFGWDMDRECQLQLRAQGFSRGIEADQGYCSCV